VALIIPSGRDIDHFRSEGRWLYQPLLDALAEDGIEPLDFGRESLPALRGREVDAIYRDGVGHHNVVGQALLAGVVERFLVERGLLRAGHRSGSARAAAAGG